MIVERAKLAAMIVALATVTESHGAHAQPALINVSVKLPDVGGALHLRGRGEGAREYVCVTSCALQIAPGRYDIQIADAHGPYATRTLDLYADETIDARPPNRGLGGAGVALVVAGGVATAVGGSVFIYGAVKNLETLSCDNPCGGVSARTIHWSLLGFGGGLALAGIGSIMVASSGSSFTETQRLSFALLPSANGHSAVALLGLRF
jgi:hypothetical protein